MINDVALFMNRPKISVVTVCFNAVETIESTIKSVIQQTYDNIEYIIIDGASTDGTLDIINNYNDRIACCLSEPDKGIYDAMNKGIKMATGEWINFMNSGDMFYKNSVLSEVALKLKDGDIIYGDTMLSFSVGSKLKKPYPLEEIVDRMVFGHQATFVRADYHKEHLFNLFYRSSADYNFFREAYLTGALFMYYPITIVTYNAEDGFSIKNKLLSMREDAIIRGQEGSLRWKVKFFRFMVKTYLKDSLVKFLPGNIVKLIKQRALKKIG